MAWSETDPQQFTCTKIWSETPDAVSFELIADNPDIELAFKPGQFASLGFMIEGKTHYRAYSISTTPGQDSLSFTVKRVPDGVVSNYIADHLQPGAKVSVLKPQGSFNSEDCAHGEKVVLISAGCGITPVMSMAKQWLKQGGVDIEFVHIARNVEHTIYHQELVELNQQHEAFHLKLLLKEESPQSYATGRLDVAWLHDLCPDIAQRSVFVCGPDRFMADVADYLQQLECDLSRCYQESFVSASTKDDSQATAGQQAEVTIHVPGFGVQAQVASGSQLVDGLEANGLPIIVACRSGICGSCKCKVESGEVVSTSRETLTDEQVEQGYVLACSTQVMSDVEVSLG
jgi:NADH oxidoreductase Hcr